MCNYTPLSSNSHPTHSTSYTDLSFKTTHSPTAWSFHSHKTPSSLPCIVIFYARRTTKHKNSWRAQESNLGGRTSHVGLKNTQRIYYSRDEICRKIFCIRSQYTIAFIATLSRWDCRATKSVGSSAFGLRSVGETINSPSQFLSSSSPLLLYIIIITYNKLNK